MTFIHEVSAAQTFTSLQALTKARFGNCGYVIIPRRYESVGANKIKCMSTLNKACVHSAVHNAQTGSIGMPFPPPRGRVHKAQFDVQRWCGVSLSDTNEPHNTSKSICRGASMHFSVQNNS